MSGTENFVNRFLSIFSAKVITSLTAIVSTPIIVRLLGPGGYGDYAVWLSVYSLYMIPISAGITEGVQKFVGEDRGVDDWRAYVVRFYLQLAGIMVVVGVVGLLAFTSLGGAALLFDDSFTRYFYFLTVFVFVGQFRAVTGRTVLGLGLEPISESLKVVKKFAIIGLGIALVAIGYGVTGMMVGHIVANALVAVVAGIVILRRVSIPALLAGPERDFPYRELLSFNVLNIVLVLLVMSLYHVDIVMLRSFTGAETTGFYKAALALAEYLWFVPIAFQTILLHTSSSLWSDDRLGTITSIASRITRYTTLLVVLMAVGVAVLADRFVVLYYGSEFIVSVTPLLLLLPGTIGFAIARPLQSISQGSGRLTVLIMAVSVAAGANVVLNALLIPRYGMNGAAVATSIGYGSMFGLFVWAARRIGYDPLHDFRIGPIVATVVVTAPLIWALDAVIRSDLVALLLVPVFGAVLFSIVAIRFGAIDVEELYDIGERLPGPADRLVVLLDRLA
ncbi:MAG: polysaccharide biosynthesis C-terminal domain-containing protein [Halobacteriota archaeon]